MILVLAGTSDARELALEIREHGYDVITSVVTENAGLAMKENGLRFLIGRLTAEQMVQVITENDISLLIDATHPFAEEASKNAMLASSQLEIPYIRYERLSYTDTTKLITEVSTYEEAAALAAERRGVVMLTTGSKTVHIFAKALLPLEDVRMLARMLPRKDNMEKCEQLGIEQKNIIAIQGPFSKELNKALYEQYKVTTVITKESGKVGSVDEKVEAAKELGIPVIMIARPNINYGAVFHTFTDVIHMIKNLEV
ncbi:precorrin-6A reductase [Bacillus alkalicellulosilyticus]|uniref:precorrin-6A reductase n=1 Tax=Alkalihalobacterium alkalicellulosilyticum TaxID=1912214 RepID=UPI000995F343|nr:precorrin-6A reductase [Bacillus alkalicellulosilyticus]